MSENIDDVDRNIIDAVRAMLRAAGKPDTGFTLDGFTLVDATQEELGERSDWKVYAVTFAIKMT